MKALILAAGLGTRLLPHTTYRPKPLFTISNRSMIDRIIQSLLAAGCDAIVVNTHHLNDQIENHIAQRGYPAPVTTLFEPAILGTGGAMKNASAFWDDQPFFVVNSDIVTDIDFARVFEFHLTHPSPATLVFYDEPRFNQVVIGDDNCVLSFSDNDFQKNENHRVLAFTGIQVVDPRVLDYIPEGKFYNSIDAYRQMISEGQTIKAFVADEGYWKDIGEPETYKQAVYDQMAPSAFINAYPEARHGVIEIHELAGDGSDRLWHRLARGEHTLIWVDHGIDAGPETSEAQSFIDIGRHLLRKGIHVPRIYDDDRLSGDVFLEDLGDVDLQSVILPLKENQCTEIIVSCYEAIIDQLVRMSVIGAEAFDTRWTYQTPKYDKDMIIHNECRYFVEAFLNRYLCKNFQFDDFYDEFSLLADRVADNAVEGLMHRDFQSRNIMVRENTFYFIDFQGARIGPIQYDLASLLIDPYVGLPYHIQKRLLDYCYEKLSGYRKVEPKTFYKGYKYCALARNLQILGAFGYLTRTKNKTYFENYIPKAVETLNHNLMRVNELHNLRIKVLGGWILSCEDSG